MKQKNPSGNVSRLRSELERRLIILRYSKGTIKNNMVIFGWVAEYLNGYGEINYTKELGQRFLIEYRLQANHRPNQFTKAKAIIRRIDEVLENKPFTQCFREAKSECPSRFTGLYNKYLESLVKRGYKKNTVNIRKRYAGRFLSRIPETVSSLEELSAADLYNTFAKYEWLPVCLIAARNFLSFLFETGVTKTNLSVCVPKPACPEPLPSIYSGDEIKQLLLSIDRACISGKRDYAILLLASHLGLRSSDIVELSFKDIDRTAKTIEIVQVKTGRPLKLVMNTEVEEALADYIQNGRPESPSDKIFLRLHAPFLPIKAACCHTITCKVFDLAGIAAQGRRRGAHSLRASYATALIMKDVPYAVVKEALGHEDRESSKYYVSVDIRRLRLCALDVPKPTGAFAVMLNDLEGVM